MTTFVSGQDEPNPTLWLATQGGKMERYCPLGIARFAPEITFRTSPSGCAKVAFIFRNSKKMFYDFPVGMEQENEKPKRAIALT